MARTFYRPSVREFNSLPCFTQWKYINTPSAAAVTRCLTPASVREGGPTSTIFLVGDSHAGALHSAVAGAVKGRMRMAFVGRAGNGFYPDWSEDNGGHKTFGSPKAWINTQLNALQANMRSGDVLCIINQHGWINYGWMSRSVLPILPAGAKVLLVGDNPFLSHTPAVCHGNHNLCSGIYPTEWDTQLQSFAAQHANVRALIQTPFWTAPPGQHFWGNVPGTTTNAYEDTHHLLPEGATYVQPFLCSALRQWDLFT